MVVQFLEDNLLAFTSKGVAVAAQGLGIKGDIKAISYEVLEEGVRRAMEAVRGLRGTFGELPYSETVLEEHFREEGAIAVALSKKDPSMKGLAGRVDLIREAGLRGTELFLAYNDEFSGNFYLTAWPGVPKVYLPNLHATRGRVFFRERERNLERALKNARALRPLFASLGLSDLEGAMEALAGLKDGEARMEGDYVLARGGETYVLRRGSVLGDPRLDGAVLLGKSARLSFPGDVEFTFKTRWGLDSAEIDWAHIRLGGEKILLHGRHTSITPLHKNPLVWELQRILVQELEERRGEFSPRTLAFLRAFVHHEDPFGALAEGRFHVHVTAEFFFET